MTPYRSRGGSAALWGILIGLLLIVLIVLHQLLLAPTARRIFSPGGNLIYSLLALLVGAALYFLAGYLAARRSGASEAGLFAGLIAGGIVGLAVLVFTVLAALAVRNGAHGVLAARYPALVRAAVRSALARSILDVFVQALVGAGLGALGGLLGRRRTPPVAGAHAAPYMPPAPVPHPSTPPSSPWPATPPSPYPYMTPATPLGDDAPTITPPRPGE
jgi:hypothetical protein